MNRIIPLLLFLATVSTLNAQRVTLKSAQDSASYAYGMIIGNSLKRQLSSWLNLEMLARGLYDVLREAELPMDQQTATLVYGRYSQEQQRRAGEESKVAGLKFLEENKKRPGVITTASGLQYEILKRGEGKESPKATDRVKVHYHGTNIDGSVFDSSVERGQPATFGLNQVIAGWTEGLQLMRVGDKFKFVIPAELAYGERSPSPKIKPNSVLIFEVELLEINPKE